MEDRIAKEAARLLMEGLPNAEVARRVDMSRHFVRTIRDGWRLVEGFDPMDFPPTTAGAASDPADPSPTEIAAMCAEFRRKNPRPKVGATPSESRMSVYGRTSSRNRQNAMSWKGAV